MIRFIGDEVGKMLTMNLALMESTSSSSIEGTRSTVDKLGDMRVGTVGAYVF